MKSLTNNPLKSATAACLLAVILGAVLFLIPRDESKSTPERIRAAEHKLIELKKEAGTTLEKLAAINEARRTGIFFIQKGDNPGGISYYLLADGKLTYWSDNEPAINENQLAEVRDGELLSLPNGDFLVNVVSQGNKRVIGLILLRHHYVYENKYLVNNFNPALGLSDDFSVAAAGDTLFLPDKHPAFLLHRDSAVSAPPSGPVISMYFLTAFLLLIAIYFVLRALSASLVRTTIFIAGIIILRTLMIYVKFPSGMYDHGIFSPAHYASSFYFNSLGDLLLHAGLLLVLSISFFENIRPFRGDGVLIVLIWLLYAFSVHSIIRGLVVNSDISFSLNRPGEINTFSILALTAISLLLLSLLFITSLVLRRFTRIQLTARNTLVGVSLFACYATLMLGSLGRIKEHETRKLIAQKVELKQDHVAEFLFGEAEARIAGDTTILSILRNAQNRNEELSSYLSQEYYNGYLSKYEVKAFAFDEGTDQTGLENFRRIAAGGKATASQGLFYLSSEASGSSYLAIIPVENPGGKLTLAITMNARFLKSEKGFPELLMSGKQEAPLSDEYSVARYSGRTLVYEFGNYIYPLTAKNFPVPAGEYAFSESGGYSHMIRTIDENTFIVVSKPAGSLFGQLTLFSWMFTFMSVLAFLLFVLAIVLGAEPGWYWSLTRRVQASVIFLVILTFVLIGFGTIYYINKKYINDQHKSISDQVNALWFMVRENITPGTDERISYTNETTQQLDRLVSNTNIDFNLYDAEGRIEYSSQPKIFDKGIVSERMNPVALLRIRDEGHTQFIHPENAGKLKYISAYAPITGTSGNIVAYLNVPYFEKQNELNNEVSVFLSALVNIYVLLFALTVLVTIFISSLITKPLLLLQEKMSGVRLGRINEKIAYRERDEIGQLVREYNRMIDELAASAEKLARSERESAWREMAKQVAHEIKNPLTPMKLSVQHLLRTFREKQQDEAMVERITSTLIQQIDTLSNIATAFSDFAKMPKPVPARVQVEQILRQVIELYNSGVEINLHAEDPGPVMAGNDQLIGIFSNLLKNAVQSIPGERRGRIDVFIRRNSDRVVIEITDNGIGIPENQRDKIFIPNFTTKSSGMGLGLAIVRNIVEEANGKVWFTSEYERGSSFFVSLPAAD